MSAPCGIPTTAFGVRSARSARVLYAIDGDLGTDGRTSHIGVLARNVGDLDGDRCADVLTGGATWRGRYPGTVGLISGMR